MSQDQIYTTKIYRNKMCNYGSYCKYINIAKPNTGYTCDFAHSEKEFGTFVRTMDKVIPTNKYKIIPCFRESSCTIKGCTYAHTPEELNLIYCNWGAYCGKTNCTIVHPEIDKKELFELIKKKFNILTQSDFPKLSKTESSDTVKEKEEKKSTIKCEITDKSVKIQVDLKTTQKEPQKQSWADISDDELLHEDNV